MARRFHEQNLWLIDERLTFHSFVSSDKPLSSLGDHLASESAKRPDLFIFDRKIVFAEDEQPLKSLVVIEFKRPQRDDYTMGNNPLTQSLDLVADIRAGTFKNDKGRPIAIANVDIPAFCYLVCDITPSLKRVLRQMDAQPLPDGQGYYNFHKEYKAYYEVMDYGKLLRDAQKRNRVFFEKLNIMTNYQPG
jgi:hypothetical protein